MATPESHRGGCRIKNAVPKSQTRPRCETRSDDAWEGLRKDLNKDLAESYPGMPDASRDECISFTRHEAKKSLKRGQYLDLRPRDRAKFIVRKFLRSTSLVDGTDFDDPLPPWKRDRNWQDTMEAMWDNVEDEMKQWAEPPQTSRDSTTPSWQRDDADSRMPDDDQQHRGRDRPQQCPWTNLRNGLEEEIEEVYPGMPYPIMDECLNVTLHEAQKHRNRRPDLKLPFPDRTACVVRKFLRTTWVMDYVDFDDTLPPWRDPDIQYKIEIARERVDIEMRQWSKRHSTANKTTFRHREDRYDANWDTGSVCIKYEDD